ncbi:MAG TPA: thioredoxin domain-containing protein [Anaerolineales bacterium]|nr:thioredoxin domain-containing protein [Anaerolineales bacterium]
MSSKITNAERRRVQRQRRRTLNIIIVAGISLIAAAFILILVLQPVDDLVPITPQTYPVPAEGLSIGNPDAPVLVEVFEDFQCPSCKQFSDAIKPQLLQTFVYNGIARLQFRHYPFIGADSLRAANATMCANEQGRFWDFHDIVFANQLAQNIGAYSDRRLEAMADQLGLDVAAWSACYDEDRYEVDIQADQADAGARGVTGTPTIFVNGGRVAQNDFTSIAAAINAARP